MSSFIGEKKIGLSLLQYHVLKMLYLYSKSHI